MIPHNSKRRATILAAGLLMSLLLAGLGNSVLEAVTHPLAERQATILKLQNAIERQQLQVAMHQQNNSKIDLLRQRSLPADASHATTLYQHWVLEQLRQLSLDHAIVTPGNPLVRADHQIIPIQVETEATLEKCLALLSRIENVLVEHRVQRLQVQRANRDSGETLRVVIQLEALSLTGALKAGVQREQIVPFDSEGQPSAQADVVVALSKNPFVPQRHLTPEPIETTTPDLPNGTPHNQEVASASPQPVWRLIATIDRAGKKEAWLFDAQSKQHVVVHEKRPVDLPSGKVNVVRITAQSIDIVQETQFRTVQLGQLIASPAQAPASPLSFILGALRIQ
jgi:hypothetical protein